MTNENTMQVIDNMLKTMVNRKASDLFISYEGALRQPVSAPGANLHSVTETRSLSIWTVADACVLIGLLFIGNVKAGTRVAGCAFRSYGSSSVVVENHERG